MKCGHLLGCSLVFFSIYIFLTDVPSYFWSLTGIAVVSAFLTHYVNSTDPLLGDIGWDPMTHW